MKIASTRRGASVLTGILLAAWCGIAQAQSVLDTLSPAARAELGRLSPEQLQKLMSELHAPPPVAATAPASGSVATAAGVSRGGILDGAATTPGAQGDGNDLLCTPWGCAGGTVMAGLGGFRASPEGTFPANFGWTAGGDVAAPLPVLARWGLGVQAAGSYGQYDLDGRDSFVGNEKKQREGFFSVGAFRRPDVYGPWWSRWGAGFAYDIALNQNGGTRTDEYHLRQWRFKASYDVTAAHELGAWAAVHDNRANVRHDVFLAPPFEDKYKAVDQLNFFYKYHLESGGSLSVFGGPGIGGSLFTGTAFLPANTTNSHPLKYTFGADAVVPLSDYFALFADGSYGAGGNEPTSGSEAASTMAWSLLTGIRFYWGGNARVREDTGRHWMPYLPDPNNGNFIAQSNFTD